MIIFQAFNILSTTPKWTTDSTTTTNSSAHSTGITITILIVVQVKLAGAGGSIIATQLYLPAQVLQTRYLSGIALWVDCNRRSWWSDQPNELIAVPYCGWLNFRGVWIFVVFVEGTIQEFQYPRIVDFLYKLWRKILLPRILNSKDCVIFL